MQEVGCIEEVERVKEVECMHALKVCLRSSDVLHWSACDFAKILEVKLLYDEKRGGSYEVFSNA